KLLAFRETFSAFDEACQEFISKAVINQAAMDHAEDYFAATEQCLEIFVTNAPRLREINTSLATNAASTESALGTLWQQGEPSTDSLLKVIAWGEKLHSRMQAFAGEDVGWLGTFR